MFVTFVNVIKKHIFAENNRTYSFYLVKSSSSWRMCCCYVSVVSEKIPRLVRLARKYVVSNTISVYDETVHWFSTLKGNVGLLRCMYAAARFVQKKFDRKYFKSKTFDSL